MLRQARLLTLLENPAVKVPTVLDIDEWCPVDIPPLFVISFVSASPLSLKYAPSVAAPDQIEARSIGAGR
jgi:hypothetical protein